jgi:hypothetical protein
LGICRLFVPAPLTAIEYARTLLLVAVLDKNMLADAAIPGSSQRERG